MTLHTIESAVYNVIYTYVEKNTECKSCYSVKMPTHYYNEAQFMCVVYLFVFKQLARP